MPQIPAIHAEDIERPVLDLSGEGLRAILQAMIKGSEDHGGIERYVDAVKLKSDMFQQAMDDIANLELEAFMGLCTFMATVRRRVGPWLNEDSFGDVRDGLAGLFDDDEPVDARAHAFLHSFEQRDEVGFEGVQELSAGQLDEILEQCRANGLGLKEVRVIRPGFAELLAVHSGAPA